MAAPIFLAPLLGLLKSSAVLKTITVVSRVAVSLVGPLRLGSKRILRWWHGHEHIAQLHAAARAAHMEGGETAGSNRAHHKWHFKRTIFVLLSTPVVLLVVASLASLERTPISGRWRIIMLNTDEEAMLVDEFLRAGAPADTHLDSTIPRNWLAILRAAYGPGAGPEGTFMGCRVLDPQTDWRAQWVLNILRRLEDGIPHSNLTAQHLKEPEEMEVDGKRYLLPPVKYPLTVRPALLKHHGHSEDEAVDGPLLTRYGLLVVDSPICNAFSVGFGPALASEERDQGEAPGVVVVYTGQSLYPPYRSHA